MKRQQYLVGHTGSWSQPLSKDKALDRVKERASAFGAPYTVGERGEMPSPLAPLPPTLSKLGAMLERARLGDVLVVAGADGGRIETKVVERKFAIAPVSGTRALKRIHRAVFLRFPSVVSYGRYSYRPVAGSSSWSQHAYCPPNAEDFHGSGKVMAAIARFLVKHHRILRVHTVIYNRRIWTRADGWHDYTGENPHTDHVHADGDPNKYGTPPAHCDKT